MLRFDFLLLYLIVIPLLLNLPLEALYHLNVGIIWLCVLLWFLSERLFEQDFQASELYFLSSWCLECLFVQKVFAFWVQKVLVFLAFLPLYQIPLSLYSSFLLGSLGLAFVVGLYSSLDTGVGLQHLMILPSVLPLVLTHDNLLACMCLTVFFMCLFWFFIGLTIQIVLSK